MIFLHMSKKAVLLQANLRASHNRKGRKRLHEEQKRALCGILLKVLFDII